MKHFYLARMNRNLQDIFTGTPNAPYKDEIVLVREPGNRYTSWELICFRTGSRFGFTKDESEGYLEILDKPITKLLNIL